jgi:hypothetical protein
VLVEELRDAVGALASRYECWAGGDLPDWPVPRPPGGAGWQARLR